MCANAPRDYTRASTKRLPVEYLHNKGQGTDEGERLSAHVHVLRLRTDTQYYLLVNVTNL